MIQRILLAGFDSITRRCDSFLSPARTRRLGFAWIGAALVGYAAALYDQIRNTAQQSGDRIGYDFVNSWSGAQLAFTGHAHAVYDWMAFHKFQQHLFPGDYSFFHYSYPPTMIVLSAPLALVDYIPGYILWQILSLLALVAALRALRPQQNPLYLALATPALLINMIDGQNGAFSAALIGGGLALLPTRPLLAGVLFGLMCYKPQMALLLPLALLAGGFWRTLLTAGATTLAVIGLSVGLFGIPLWQAYFEHAHQLRHTILELGINLALFDPSIWEGAPGHLESLADAIGAQGWHRFVSVFTTSRQLGFSIQAAYAIQFAATFLAALLVGWIWYRPHTHDLRAATLVLALFFATPYLHDYDMVITIFAVLWLNRTRQGQGKFSRALLLTLPLLGTMIDKQVHVSLAPILLLPAFAQVLQASHRESAARAATNSQNQA